MAKRKKETEVERITLEETDEDLEKKLEKAGQKVGRSVGKALKSSKARVDTVQKRLKQSEALQKTRSKSKEVLEKTKESLEKTRDSVLKKKSSKDEE